MSKRQSYIDRVNSQGPMVEVTDPATIERAYQVAKRYGIAIEGHTTKAINKGVPGPSDVDRALSRLAILPNPNDLTIPEPEKWVESPWRVTDVPTVNPNAWDDAVIDIVSIKDLVATDAMLRRKRVAKHIEAMGQALTPYRSLAMVQGNVIVDGHHRLMAWWLLGQETAPVWRLK